MRATALPAIALPIAGLILAALSIGLFAQQPGAQPNNDAPAPPAEGPAAGPQVLVSDAAAQPPLGWLAERAGTGDGLQIARRNLEQPRIQPLLDGTAHGIVTLSPLTKAEIDAIIAERHQAPIASLVGIDAIIVMRRQNPERLPYLTIDQLRAIYSGEFERWEQVEPANRLSGPIQALVPPPGSDTYTWVKEVLLRGGEFGANVISDQAVSTEMPDQLDTQGFTEAIAISSVVVSEEKVLTPLARPNQTVGHLPHSVEDERKVINETYTSLQPTLRRPVIVYTLGDPTGAIGDLVTEADTQETQAALRDRFGYMPIR